MRARAIYMGLLVLLAVIVAAAALTPQLPRFSHLQGFVAAFPGESVTMIVDFRTGWWVIPSRVRAISEISLGEQVSVLSFDTERGPRSGSLQVVLSSNKVQESSIEALELRTGSKWVTVELGNVALDIRHDDKDRSLVARDEAILMNDRDQNACRATFYNASSNTVTVTGVSGSGLTCLSCPVDVESGGTITLEFALSKDIDFVRPWVHYRTSSGDHVTPGPACYRR